MASGLMCDLVLIVTSHADSTVIGGFTFLVSGENFLKLDNPPDILA